MTTAVVSAPAVPAGYAVERERGTVVVALPSIIQEVRALLARSKTLYEAAAVAPAAQAFTGRGAAYRVSTAHGDWVVRHYHRGGAVARVLRDEYLRGGEPRPLRELRASVTARDRGVATPEVLAAVIYAAGPFYRADLATRYVPDSIDLARIALGTPRADPDTRRDAWHAAGVLLRTAFSAGVVHADLNLRNVLIAREPGGPRALLLDLDRARVHDVPVNRAARAVMLDRLHRSRRKIERELGTTASADELAAFAHALEP